jgi:hypothetical protein
MHLALEGRLHARILGAAARKQKAAMAAVSLPGHDERYTADPRSRSG